MTDKTPDVELPTRAEVVIVGAGLMGAATAWHLAGRGLDVVVLEQDKPASVHGSSHGSARIVRRAYPQEDYVRLTGEAFELWRELEAQARVTILRIIGGLDHGAGRDPHTIARALDKVGVPGQLMPPQSAQERWPGMVFDGPVLYHPQAGTMDPELAVHSLLDVARRGGATLHHGVRVDTLEPGAQSISVATSHGDIHAEHVVVAAGAWCGGILDGLVQLPSLDVTEHRVFHFPRRDEAITWPVTIHRAALDLYHLPGGRDGGSGDARKIAQHTGRRADPRSRDPEIDHAARTRIIEYVRRWLPGLDPTPFGEATCLYTRTPSEDFIIDRIGRIVVASACSGHGAKLSPVVGRLVADHVTNHAPPLPRFSLASHRA